MIEKIIARLEEEANSVITNIFASEEDDHAGIENNAKSDTYERAIEIVQEVAKEYGNGWIPVEVELPKKSGCYTVTEEILSLNDRNKVVGTRVAYEVQYDAQNEIWRRANTLRVIAWKPKDTPYQKGEPHGR